MPAFVAALVVAPSLSSSSTGSSALFARSRSPSSLVADRRASVSLPYRHSTPARESPLSPLSSNSPSPFPSRAPGFGSRPSSPVEGGRKGRKRRAQRPTTAEGSAIASSSASFPAIDVSRPSLVYQGGGHQGYDKSLIRALREGGIPVSSLRSTAQIQSHINLSIPLPPTPTSPSPLVEFTHPFALPSSSDASSSSTPLGRSRTSSGTPPSHSFILLLPLNDLAPSTLATARLIKESGKTPSSICFDLEHEVGEKEWERTFVEALAVIEDVQRKRGDWRKDVLVVAYSANPELSEDSIERCKRAGADAVLFPPFEESSATIEQLQQALSSRQEQFSAFSFDTSSSRPSSSSRSLHPPHPLSQLTSPPDTPPTPPLSSPPASHPFSFGSTAQTSPRRPPLQQQSFRSFQFSDAPSTPETASFVPLCAADPAGPRRTSVDTGGLALALERAQALEDDEGPDEGNEEGVDDDTVFAELLGEMHRQTRLAVDGRMDELPSPLTEQRRLELIQEMSTWDFQPHKLSGDDLYHCSCILFEATLMMEGLWDLNIPFDQVHRFLFCVRQIYHAPNPYHNWVHATDVLQASYSFLAAVGVVPSFEFLLSTTSGRPSSPWKRSPWEGEGREDRAREVLRPQDAFALVIAAIGHDVAHPGLSNVFMKNAKTPISSVYSDSSVLENMHCMLITSLLRKHGFDFLFPSPKSSASSRRPSSLPPTPPPFEESPPPSDFSPPSPIDWTDFRSILSASILVTDMSIHFGYIRTIVEMGERLEREREGIEEPEVEGAPRPTEEELVKRDRIRLCQAVMKCSDISNPTRPHEVSKHWSTVLLEEWTNQAELESGLNIPVTVIKNADAALQAKGQIGFLDLFVHPLFTATAAVMPQLSIYVSYSADNRAIWADRLQALTSDPDAPSVPIPPSATSSFSGSTDRPLFPLTVPTALLATSVAMGSEDNASSDGSVASSAATITSRRTMQAGRRGGVERASQKKKTLVVPASSREGSGMGRKLRSESFDASATTAR